MDYLALQLRLALGVGRAATPWAQEDPPEHGQKPEGASLGRPLGCGMIEERSMLNPVLQTLQSRQLGLRVIVACIRGKAHIVSHLIILSFRP